MGVLGTVMELARGSGFIVVAAGTGGKPLLPAVFFT